jgi:hypothetical protein
VIPPYRDPLRDVAEGFQSGLQSIAGGLLRARESKEQRDAEARAQVGSILNQAATQLAQLQSVDKPDENVQAQIQQLQQLAQDAQGILTLQRPGDAATAFGVFSGKYNLAGALGAAGGAATAALRQQNQIDAIRGENAQLLTNLTNFIKQGVKADDPNFLTNLNMNISLAQTLMDSGFDLPASGERTLGALVSGLQGVADQLRADPRFQAQVTALDTIRDAAARRAGLAVQMDEATLAAQEAQNDYDTYTRGRQQLLNTVSDLETASGLVEQAVTRGDTNTLLTIAREIDDPDSERGKWYRAAGYTSEGIRARLDEAGQNTEWRTLNREAAMSALRTQRFQNVEQERSAIARAYGSEGIDGWWANLSQAEKDRLGGPAMLQNMKMEASVYELGLRQPLRAEAWSQVNTLLSLPVPATADGFITEAGKQLMQARLEEIYGLLAPQMGASYADQFVAGAGQLLERDAQSWEWEHFKTEANLNYVQAQTAALMAQAGLNPDGSPKQVTDVSFLLQASDVAEKIRAGVNQEITAVNAALDQNQCKPTAMASSAGGTQPGIRANEQVCVDLTTRLNELAVQSAWANNVAGVVYEAFLRGVNGFLPSNGLQFDNPLSDTSGAGGVTAPFTMPTQAPVPTAGAAAMSVAPAVVTEAAAGPFPNVSYQGALAQDAQARWWEDPIYEDENPELEIVDVDGRRSRVRLSTIRNNPGTSFTVLRSYTPEPRITVTNEQGQKFQVTKRQAAQWGLPSGGGER